jgi:ankyrin repeat protein
LKCDVLRHLVAIPCYFFTSVYFTLVTSQVATLMHKYKTYWEAEEAGGDNKESGKALMQDALDQAQGIVDGLIKAGADPTLKDKEGRKAADFDFDLAALEAAMAAEAAGSERDEL